MYEEIMSGKYDAKNVTATGLMIEAMTEIVKRLIELEDEVKELKQPESSEVLSKDGMDALNRVHRHYRVD